MTFRIFVLSSLFLVVSTACTLTNGPNQVAEIATPNTPTRESRCQVTNAEPLAIRQQPNIEASETAILEAGTTSEVMGRTTDGSWWQVQTGSRVGWADASALTTTGNCTSIGVIATATPAATSTPDTPTARFSVDINVRRGPGVIFAPPIGNFRADDEVEILGVNPGGTWYQVAYGGATGWVFAELTTTSGNLSGLPINPGPATPTPTNTPIPSTPTPTLDPTTNYLQDAGFEGNYRGLGAPTLNLPGAWELIVVETPRQYDWQNLQPSVFPHITLPEIRSGTRSLNINRNFATFTAVLYQRATVPANITVRGSAWAWLHTCDPDPGICTSDPDSGARVRVGVDPNGGTDPNAGSVVWSGFITPHDSWGNVGASAQANGSTVTVFLYATQDWPRGLNQLYWDDAALNVGG